MQYFIFHLHFFLFVFDSLYGSVFVLYMIDENKNDLFLARNNDAQLYVYAEMYSNNEWDELNKINCVCVRDNLEVLFAHHMKKGKLVPFIKQFLYIYIFL